MTAYILDFNYRVKSSTRKYYEQIVQNFTLVIMLVAIYMHTRTFTRKEYDALLFEHHFVVNFVLLFTSLDIKALYIFLIFHTVIIAIW